MEFGEKRPSVSAEKRAVVVAAFNRLYQEEYVKYCVGRKGYAKFRTLRAGVKMALGYPVLDPLQAIPDSYQGDGSYEIQLPLKSGVIVSRREYLPWIFPTYTLRGSPDSYLLLECNSCWFQRRLLVELGFDGYQDRVRLEAYYRYLEDLRIGQANSPIRNYHSAAGDLFERREIILPTLANS